MLSIILIIISLSTITIAIGALLYIRNQDKNRAGTLRPCRGITIQSRIKVFVISYVITRETTDKILFFLTSLLVLISSYVIVYEIGADDSTQLDKGHYAIGDSQLEVSEGGHFCPAADTSIKRSVYKTSQSYNKILSLIDILKIEDRYSCSFGSASCHSPVFSSLKKLRMSPLSHKKKGSIIKKQLKMIQNVKPELSTTDNLVNEPMEQEQRVLLIGEMLELDSSIKVTGDDCPDLSVSELPDDGRRFIEEFTSHPGDLSTGLDPLDFTSSQMITDSSGFISASMSTTPYIPSLAIDLSNCQGESPKGPLTFRIGTSSCMPIAHDNNENSESSFPLLKGLPETPTSESATKVDKENDDDDYYDGGNLSPIDLNGIATDLLSVNDRLQGHDKVLSMIGGQLDQFQQAYKEIHKLSEQVGRQEVLISEMSNHIISLNDSCVSLSSSRTKDSNKLIIAVSRLDELMKNLAVSQPEISAKLSEEISRVQEVVECISTSIEPTQHGVSEQGTIASDVINSSYLKTRAGIINKNVKLPAKMLSDYYCKTGMKADGMYEVLSIVDANVYILKKLGLL